LYELNPDIVRPLDEGDPHAGAKVPGFHLDRDTAASELSHGRVDVGDLEAKMVGAKVGRAASGEVLALRAPRIRIWTPPSRSVLVGTPRES